MLSPPPRLQIANLEVPTLTASDSFRRPRANGQPNTPFSPSLT